MIDPKELRIGNWVMTKERVPVQVLSYFDKSIRNEIYTTSNTDFKYEEDDCDGIPISEEILLKAEFIPVQGSLDIKWTKDYINVLVQKEFCITEYGEDFHFLHGNISTPILFVHELQNLWYAITKQELEINL